MTTKEEFIPKYPSRYRAMVLIMLMILIYIVENQSFISFHKGLVFTYVIIPVLWTGVVCVVWLFPRVRTKGLVRLRSFLNWWAFNFAIIYIIILMGFATFTDGFGKSPYDHSLAGVITNLVFLGTTLVGREFVRAYLVNSVTKKDNFLVMTGIAFFMTVSSVSLNKLIKLEGYREMIEFTGQYFIPDFAQNLLVTYMVLLGGPCSSVIYLGILQGFEWFCPILPNLKWINKALIGTLYPLFTLMFFQDLYKEESKELRRREKDSIVGWIITSILSIGMVWFSVGVFPIYPTVIATGSMEPMIRPGDVVLIERVDIEAFQTGDVIQFRRNGMDICHRIINVVEEEKQKRYQTKGDNNSGPDSELVKPEELRGKVIKVIPKIGWPTLLIKNSKDIPVEEVEF